MLHNKISAERAQKVVSIITDANSPKNHLIHLQEMLICWLRANNEDIDEHEQGVYLTFIVLSSALKAMEEPKDE